MAQESSSPGRSIQPFPDPAGRKAEIVRTGPSAVRSGIEALRRVVPFVNGVARSVIVFGLVVLAGAAAIWLALLGRGATGPGRPVTLSAWGVILAIPPCTLLTIGLALRLLARLPDRLAEVPDRAREHAASLGRLAGEARRIRQRGWVRSGWSVIRLWRTAAASRDLIAVAAPVAFLFSPTTLFLLFIAAAAGVVEILGGIVSLILLV
jgi:hypothetical protein